MGTLLESESGFKMARLGTFVSIGDDTGCFLLADNLDDAHHFCVVSRMDNYQTKRGTLHCESREEAMRINTIRK